MSSNHFHEDAGEKDDSHTGYEDIFDSEEKDEDSF
jgi:hypothetical protein